LLAELCARIVDGAERATQFLVQIGRIPGLRIDRLNVLQMLGETFVRHAQLLEFLLRIVGFAFQNHERTR